MKRLTTLLLLSVFMAGCGIDTQQSLAPVEQVQSQNVKASIYPFDVQKDFFPLYNTSNWKYDVFDKDNKLVTTLNKTLDVTNEFSLDHDIKNNYYVTALKKTY